jgi:hypothetical protein
MKFKIKVLLVILFLSTITIFPQEIIFKGKLINPPVATRQLGPAIFFSNNIF